MVQFTANNHHRVMMVKHRHNTQTSYLYGLQSGQQMETHTVIWRVTCGLVKHWTLLSHAFWDHRQVYLSDLFLSDTSIIFYTLAKFWNDNFDVWAKSFNMKHKQQLQTVLVYMFIIFFCVSLVWPMTNRLGVGRKVPLSTTTAVEEWAWTNV